MDTGAELAKFMSVMRKATEMAIYNQANPLPMGLAIWNQISTCCSLQTCLSQKLL